MNIFHKRKNVETERKKTCKQPVVGGGDVVKKKNKIIDGDGDIGGKKLVERKKGDVGERPGEVVGKGSPGKKCYSVEGWDLKGDRSKSGGGGSWGGGGGGGALDTKCTWIVLNRRTTLETRRRNSRGSRFTLECGRRGGQEYFNRLNRRGGKAGRP